MLYRSLGKSLYSNGKRITEPKKLSTPDLFVNADCVKEEDSQTGWVYVLKSKSNDDEIKSRKDLYKIGFSSRSVDERIKNAKNEATYLYADVKKVATYGCYNRNAHKYRKSFTSIFCYCLLEYRFIQ